MIKIKSKSREIKEVEAVGRHAFSRRSGSKENRVLKTAEHRNHSNDYLPHSHHFQNQVANIKARQFSSSKINRKQLKQTEIQFHPLKHVSHDLKQSKKSSNNKIFIGTKLRKKLQKYFLFTTLVNFSLRVNYQKPERKKYIIYVGKGNNSKLVKTIFLNRFWWTLTNEESEANLVWTQKSKKKVFAVISEVQKQEIKLSEIAEPLVKRKLKIKKGDKKGTYFDEQMQSILCQKDKLMIKSECKRESLYEDVKSFIKRLKNDEKRKQIKVTHNHLENHRMLSNKKNLFYNLKAYCQQRQDNLFNYVPLTFHIKGLQQEYVDINKYENDRKQHEKLMWIVKPGENSNRGTGIQICKTVEHVRKHIERQNIKHPQRTFIVQKYINPFLFHRRKFDIRCFVLVTATPFISAYFYPDGYIRTSSFQFSTKNCSNKYIHLTNDAIQKKASQYSKYENGNKVTFQQFQNYLDMFVGHKRINFFIDILPIIRDLVILSIKSARNFEESNKEHTFQIFGYDFMIDDEMQPWLIEINTNPCLETGCEILNQIIPSMVENAVKIAVDPVFKPPKIEDWSMKELLCCSERLLEGNKFELIYSQIHEQ